jgi:hypothetical protein
MRSEAYASSKRVPGKYYGVTWPSSQIKASAGADLGRVGLVVLVALRLRGRVEPPGELVATVARGQGRLRLARRAVGRAGEPRVEVVVMAPPRTDLAQPGAIGGRGLAQRALQDRMHEQAIDPRIRREQLDDARDAGGERARGATQLGVDHRDRVVRRRRRRVPDVHVEARLMARVARRCGAAARLRQIADGQKAERERLYARAELADRAHEQRMAEHAVALGTRDAKPVAAERQRDRALHAAGAEAADRERRPDRGRLDRAPDRGRRRRICVERRARQTRHQKQRKHHRPNRSLRSHAR